jgi:hypothetical protein
MEKTLYFIFLKELEENFLKELRKNKFKISNNAICRIYKDSIELGIFKDVSDKEANKMVFGSVITIYVRNNIDIFGKIRNEIKENEISFGSCGAFSPSDEASYWRTIHAASLLKNWELACKIVNKYTEF